MIFFQNRTNSDYIIFQKLIIITQIKIIYFFSENLNLKIIIILINAMTLENCYVYIVKSSFEVQLVNYYEFD